MAQEMFKDETGPLDDYTFEINHRDEEAWDRSHESNRTAPTADTGFVRQFGGPGPKLFKFGGTILTQAQLDAMSDYFEACADRPITFRDYTGTDYTVIITSFNPIRHWTLRNPRDPELGHYWTYRLEMEVLSAPPELPEYAEVADIDGRNRFRDGAGILPDYQFQFNHKVEN